MIIGTVKAERCRVKDNLHQGKLLLNPQRSEEMCRRVINVV
ncbi:hypothetical protein J2Z65_000895 [Paenibacillus aceris]|uniref:Uncharacterized protein n=1 Tax=Paenibacillus aceris TaxID=869555 RepID=A0ABS4HSU7_9BACL|nr:hypothetical protein [Paenibacillus aceris]